MDPKAWTAARLPSDLVHLDVAACGRVSAGVLAAQTAHLVAEAERGGYVAEASWDDAGGRAALAALVGLGGDDLAWSDGAGTAFATLMQVWPLGRGARIGVVGSDDGANARVLQRLAARDGWVLVPLPVDGAGRITAVPPGLSLVTFPQVPSQYGVAQPVAEVLAAGVPVVLDVAQSLGMVDVPDGCAAYVGTSRTWLCGPRGVGFTVVDPAVAPSLGRPPTLAPYDDVRRLDSQESHVAGRVGLAQAAREWSPQLGARVLALSSYARQVLGVGGWRVVERVVEPTGITTLVGGDPVAARQALLARGLLVSAVPISRAAALRALPASA